MKAFTSKILSESSIDQYNTESIKSIKQTDESMLYRILQFNEEAAQAELKSTRDFYFELLKNVRGETKSIDPAYDALFNQYDTVRLASRNIFYRGEEIFSDNGMYKIFDKIRSSPTVEVKMIAALNAPGTMYAGNTFIQLSDFAKKGIEELKKESPDETVLRELLSKINEESICSYIGKLLGLENTNSVNSSIDAYDKAFTYEERTTLSNNIESVINGNSIYERCRIYISHEDMIQATDLDLFVSLLHTNCYKVPVNLVRDIINAVCDAISTYTILIGKFNDICIEKRKKIYNANIAILKEKFSDIFSESMSLFGDEFDKQSMFDSLDPEDFNRTDFMDLSLVSEHVYNMDVIQAKKYAIALEASLLANKQYDKLGMVHEGVLEKVKNGIGKIIEAIKKLASKFVADILGMFAPEKVYLEKYKNIILNNTIPENTTVQFEGYALEAMERLSKNFVIPTPSYTQLMQNPEQFESEDKFFNLNKNNFGIGGDFRKDNDESLADALKVYWGYKAKTTPKQLTFKDINPRIKQIYDFLLKTTNEANNLKKQVGNIDRTYKNYLASAKSYAAKQPAENTQDNKSEGYYSIIFDKYVKIDEKTSIGNIETQPAQTNNTNNQQNDGGENKSTQGNTNLTRGDTTSEVKKSGDTEDKIVRNMEIYTNTCRTVVSARATGFRYCHQELMAIMKAIVKAKLGDKADIRNDPDAAKAAKTTEQQANNSNNTRTNVSER